MKAVKSTTIMKIFSTSLLLALVASTSAFAPAGKPFLSAQVGLCFVYIYIHKYIPDIICVVIYGNFLMDLIIADADRSYASSFYGSSF